MFDDHATCLHQTRLRSAGERLMVGFFFSFVYASPFVYSNAARGGTVFYSFQQVQGYPYEDGWAY